MPWVPSEVLQHLREETTYLRGSLSKTQDELREMRREHATLAELTGRLESVLGIGAPVAAIAPEPREPAGPPALPSVVRQALGKVAPKGSELHQPALRWAEERLEDGMPPEQVAANLLKGEEA